MSSTGPHAPRTPTAAKTAQLAQGITRNVRLGWLLGSHLRSHLLTRLRTLLRTQLSQSANSERSPVVLAASVMGQSVGLLAVLGGALILVGISPHYSGRQ